MLHFVIIFILKELVGFSPSVNMRVGVFACPKEAT